MAKYTIQTYAVANCKNQIVAVDGYFACRRIVREAESRCYDHLPYRLVELSGEIEGNPVV